MATRMLRRSPSSVTVPLGVCSSSVAPTLYVARERIELVVTRHVRAERVACDRHERRMRHPRSVMAVQHLTRLVGSHPLLGVRVRGRIVLDRNLRRHPAHCERAAAMAGADEQLRVRAHARLRHGDLRAIGQDRRRILAARLDEAEDVVPPAAVESHRRARAARAGSRASGTRPEASR